MVFIRTTWTPRDAFNGPARTETDLMGQRGEETGTQPKDPLMTMITHKKPLTESFSGHLDTRDYEPVLIQDVCLFRCLPIAKVCVCVCVFVRASARLRACASQHMKY